MPLASLKNSDGTLTGADFHEVITKQQRAEYKALYKELGGSTDSMTWDQVRKAEIDAHTSAGYSQEQAAAMVDHGITHYTDAGVTKPSKIPWSGASARMKGRLD